MDKPLHAPVNQISKWKWVNIRWRLARTEGGEWNGTSVREREMVSPPPSEVHITYLKRPDRLPAYLGHSQNLGTKPSRATMWSWGKSFIRPPPRARCLECMEKSRACPPASLIKVKEIPPGEKSIVSPRRARETGRRGRAGAGRKA